jgi:flagellar motility protein MotE (MotC chaperone)
LAASQNQQANIKELAKTFETMKTSEIGPILKKVDNATVIALYKNMGSRSKKMILTALSNDRAAEITQELAGMHGEG